MTAARKCARMRGLLWPYQL